ncbi:MAG: redox protein [Solibacillus sp.]|uniref:redox protein n=1 Tax=unclassified Solibacillus TaxID=2637870 RepID=UPI0030F4FA01
MEAKKVTVTCKNCGEDVLIDFNTVNFSTEIQVMNGKKQQKRTYIEHCPHCHAINTITSENKEDWGNRKGPNIKFFLFSGFFSCLTVIILGILAIYFAFKGFGFIMDWLFN